MPTYEEILQENRQRYESELLDLLRIPSISASSDHVAEVQRAAEWVAQRLEAAGLEHTAILPTGVHSCVYADWLHAPDKPTLLIYGHFDVQPPDPLELWNSPPFEPVVEEGRVYARGACDMKANLLLCIIAVETMIRAGDPLPVNIKFLFEGQEEIGSRDLPEFIAAYREMLACDLVLTADGGQWSEKRPLLYLGTKGMCALQVDIETAAMDLHSGIYGGAVPNAIHAMVELLDALRDENGRILVSGFYDRVVPISPEDRAAIAAVPFDAGAYRADIGVDALIGEEGYTTYERAWARPTLEVNGVWGGYQGDGTKTVIPALAHAKLTCRLVPDQEPEEIIAAVIKHILGHAPAGARVSVTPLVGKARPYLIPADQMGNQIAASVLQDLYDSEPLLIRSGGTLPIMDLFLQHLRAYTVTVGFALDDERAHSPNEFFRLLDFERGQITYCRLLERFGEADKSALAVKRD